MMLVHVGLLSLLVACTGMYAGDAPVLEIDAARDRTPTTDGTVLDAALEMVSLPTTPGIYRGACNGSAAIGLDFDHFLGMSDDDQRIRVFKRGTNGDAIQDLDFAVAFGVASTAKVDFEDLERVGNRVYAISSHGRKDDGNLDLDRYRFVAIDVGGQAPGFTFAVAGSRSSLLSDMLVAANWSTPNPSIIDTLKNASKLEKQQGDNLKPQANGMNIEGLAHAPTTAVTERMMIGLRNPRPNDKAIAVSLNNAAAVITGATAQFGEAFVLDFGGLGIRGMSWSPVLQQILIIAGPHDDAPDHSSSTAGRPRRARRQRSSRTSPRRPARIPKAS